MPIRSALLALIFTGVLPFAALAQPSSKVDPNNITTFHAGDLPLATHSARSDALLCVQSRTPFRCPISQVLGLLQQSDIPFAASQTDLLAEATRARLEEAGKASIASLSAEIARAQAAEASKAGLDANGKVSVGNLGGIQAGNLAWTVCATGCTYTSPANAWAAARAFVAFGPYSSITINVADGAYPLTAPFVTEEPGTSGIRFVGNVANPAAVQFNYTNITGNNGSAVVAVNGGRFGNSVVPGMNGISIIGSGAQVDRQTWNDQSYGAAFLSLGSGSQIHIGGAMNTSHFYYSVLADEGGRFVGDPGSNYSYSGDVNLLARHNGVIHCLSCHMTTASHVLPGNGGTFGFNIMAEAGGAVYADGSTGADAQVACFAAQTGASMWAHDVEGANCGTAGARVSQGAFAEFTRAKFHNSPLGIYVLTNGSVSVDGAQLYANQYEGLHLVGGQAYGGGLASHDNGSFGIKLEKGSRAELYGALAGSTGNASGAVFNETGAPCPVLNGACLPPSMLIVD